MQLKVGEIKMGTAETLKLIPVGQRVIIQEERVDITEGGIIVPADSSQSMYPQGIVLAKGPECIWDDIQVGDTVYYGRHNHYLAEHEGYSYRILNEEDLIAVVKTAENEEKILDTL